MNLNLAELKSLATAAMRDRHDYAAANDYGMAMPPAVALELIAEIERHRLVNAEGCKPDSNILLSSVPCAGVASCRSLDKAEGGTPDSDIVSAYSAAGRPDTPAMSNLSYRMQAELSRLHKRPDDYYGSCTNPTMTALKKRGLVEIEWSEVPGSIFRSGTWVITPAGVAALGCQP